MSSGWNTAFGIIFGVVLAKGFDLMFSEPPRYLVGSFLTILGLVGLLFTIPWTRSKALAALRILYAYLGTPYPTISLIVISLIGAIIFGVGWWALRNLQSVAQTHKITWDFDDPSHHAYFLGLAGGGGQQTRVIAFQASGVNNSSEPINKIGGYIQSDLTNLKLPILIQTSNGLAPIEHTLGIPPRAKFTIVSANFSTVLPDKPEVVSPLRFLSVFGAFTFIFEYDSEKYVRHFSADEVKQLIVRFEYGSSTTPQVTQKPFH